MKKLAFASALLLAAAPAAAQVATLGGRSVQSTPTQAPTTGVFCIGEMTAKPFLFRGILGFARGHSLVTPATVKRTVTPRRPPNGDLRTREYLTEAEVERVMTAAKKRTVNAAVSEGI